MRCVCSVRRRFWLCVRWVVGRWLSFVVCLAGIGGVSTCVVCVCVCARSVSLLMKSGVFFWRVILSSWGCRCVRVTS